MSELVPGLERHCVELVNEQAERLQRRRERRRRRARRGSIGLATATAVLLVVTLFALPSPGGGPDVLASARAAAALGDGGILHTRVRFEHGPHIFTGGTIYPDTGRRQPVRQWPPKGKPLTYVDNGLVERWTATDPFRQREIRYYETADDRTESTQTVTAPGRVATRNSWTGGTRVQRLTWRQEREQQAIRDRLGTLASAGSGYDLDVLASVRRLLAAGNLRDAGTRDLDGREVRRLVGTTSGRADGKVWSPPARYEYLVDAATFVPVQVTSVRVLPARPDAEEPAARKPRRLEERWVFEVYERLPITEQTQRLLEIDSRG